MPKGVPKAGFRVTQARINQGWKPNLTQVIANLDRLSTKNEKQELAANMPEETDEQILQRINDRFDVLREMSEALTVGLNRAMVVSGPPGIGKSFTLEEVLKRWDPTKSRYTIVKGYVRAPGLLKLLYQHKEKNQVLVFDDADTIFFDETSLNMLKAVCDSSENRRVDYRVESTIVDDETGLPIEKSFDFNGSIVFISNLDFDAMIASGNKLAPHLKAMMDRAYYIDTTMKTRRDIMLHIKHIGHKMLGHLSLHMRDDVMNFITDHKDELRELSLRTVVKVANIRAANSPRWKSLAKVTMCKN